MTTLRPLERAGSFQPYSRIWAAVSKLSVFRDGTRAFLHNCSRKDHSIKLWTYVSNLKCFFLIEKRKTQEREILTWSPSRDIEAFNHGACLRPLLKLYQLERWILQTQGVRGLCHLVIGISWSQPGLDLMLLHSVDPDTQHCGFFGFWWMICSRMALSFIRDTLKGLQLQYVVWRNCNSEVPGSVLLRRLKILF